MLIGGKWGDGWACPVCGGSNSGALLKCRSCEYKRPADDEIKGWWSKTSSSIAVGVTTDEPASQIGLHRWKRR